MNKPLLIVSLASLLLVACGKQEEQAQTAPPAQQAESAMNELNDAAANAMSGAKEVMSEAKEAVSETAGSVIAESKEALSDAADNAMAQTDAAVTAAKETAQAATAKTQEAVTAAKETVKEAAEAATKETQQVVTEVAAKAGAVAAATQSVLAKDDALVLANKSGCLACHAVDKKVVGPPWQDVAARYRGKDARTQLVDKVSTGGKGNWTDVTGGVPMPPYSPRVSKENIEKMVDFILSL